MTSDKSNAYEEFIEKYGEFIREYYQGHSISDLLEQNEKHDESIKRIDESVQNKQEFLGKVWDGNEIFFDFLGEFVGKGFEPFLDAAKDIIFDENFKEFLINSKVFGVQQLKSIKESIQNEQKLLQKFIEEMKSCSVKKFGEKCKIPKPNGEVRPNIEKAPEVNFDIS